jgi:hypothetical protein
MRQGCFSAREWCIEKNLFQHEIKEICISNQISTPQASRFLEESIKPFEAKVMSPSRSAFAQAGLCIECSPYRESRAYRKAWTIFMHPDLLFGRAEGHE